MKLQLALILLAFFAVFLLAGCSQPPKAPSEFVECGTDKQCGDNIMKNCWKGHVVDSYSELAYGLRVNSSMDVNILGPEGSKCVFEMKFLKASVSDPQKLLSTEELDKVQAAVKETIGKKARCAVGLSEIFAINSGNFKLEEFCTGDLIKK